MFGRRADATQIPDLSNLRRMMPFVSPRRNDSAFYMMQDIGADAALEYVDKRSAERPPDRPITLFHLLLRAVSHAITLRPAVNRFVKGGRLWQRDGVWLTFSAKRSIEDGAPLFTVKRRFESAHETLDEMVDAIYDRLQSSRRGQKTTSDRETALLLRLPVFAVAAVMALVRLADRWGLLPRAMIDADPLFATVFLANLGSIDYPAGHHHLWEYGTCSIFGVMGRITAVEGGRRRFTMAWTYDERIEDGLYSQLTLEMIRKLIESPELLELTTAQLVERGWERR
jgi:hypothetical protein